MVVTHSLSSTTRHTGHSGVALQNRAWCSKSGTMMQQQHWSQAAHLRVMLLSHAPVCSRLSQFN